ncbi:MAG: hypothetical protein KAI66_15505, partial [Lentisphaeria bacterium]|nr:hypothetical protein [Lentisphaeria bacterium]
DWWDQSWASPENGKAHFVQLDFPNPTRVKRVAIYWSLDGGVMRTARKLRLETGTAGETKTLWSGNDLQRSPVTIIDLPAASSVESLRLVQPADGGPAERPGIMWIREVEVFGK